jgi:flagellar basal-body rod protein FlgC
LMNRSGLPDPPGVKAVRVVQDPRPPRQVFEPQHPDANAEGFVLMPDINTIEEMVNLISASRAYEANVTAMNVTKTMSQKALEIGR